MEEHEFDFDYRPDDYLFNDRSIELLLSAVTDEERRQHAVRLIKEGRLRQLNELLSGAAMSRDARNYWDRVYPNHGLNEYYDERPGEEEIAHVHLTEMPGDQVAVKARRLAGRWHYRVIDNMTCQRWIISQKTSRRPLRMGDVIHMMDTAYVYPSSRGLVWPLVESQTDCGSYTTVDEITDSVSVCSGAYPELGRYYLAAMGRWVPEYQAATDAIWRGTPGITRPPLPRSPTAPRGA